MRVVHQPLVLAAVIGVKIINRLTNSIGQLKAKVQAVRIKIYEWITVTSCSHHERSPLITLVNINSHIINEFTLHLRAYISDQNVFKVCNHLLWHRYSLISCFVNYFKPVCTTASYFLIFPSLQEVKAIIVMNIKKRAI